MSRNGSGTYNLPSGNPVVSGTTISSTWANNTFNDVANALTGSVASDGQTPMTGALNMGNNKITSVTDPTVSSDASTKNYVDNSIATQASSDATTYLAKTANLSDVVNSTTARTNLSAAKSGANSDITSLSGLSTALSVGQGGTGQTSFTDGQILIGNTSGNTLTKATLTAGTNTTITNGSGSITIASSAYPLTSGTAQASTSGTTIDFTSIPSWVKRITVMFSGVSTSGISNFLIQIGSGSTTNTGYTSLANFSGGVASSSAGFIATFSNAAANLSSGVIVLTLLGSNTWTSFGGLIESAASYHGSAGTSPALGGSLDRVVITTVNGTDTFDAGSINILYE